MALDFEVGDIIFSRYYQGIPYNPRSLYRIERIDPVTSYIRLSNEYDIKEIEHSIMENYLQHADLIHMKNPFHVGDLIERMSIGFACGILSVDYDCMLVTLQDVTSGTVFMERISDVIADIDKTIYSIKRRQKIIKCTCDGYTQLHFGCQCGAFKLEMANKLQST